MKRVAVMMMMAFLFAIPAYAQDSLGIPCSDKKWYARNIWDMTVFDGRLYIGCGDVVSNAGPIPIWSYENGKWNNEFTVDEEQISRFRVLDGVLVIPGTDSRESWDFGNWYELGSDGWVKHRNIPKAVHVLDMIDYDSLRFAALGVTPGNDAVQISSDGGQTWQGQIVPPGSQGTLGDCLPQTIISVNQMTSFFTIGKDLYADSDTYGYFTCTNNEDAYPETKRLEVLHWDGQAFQPVDVDPFPGISTIGMRSATSFVDQVVYLGHSDDASAAFTMGSDLKPRQLSVSACSLPEDIEVSSGALYLLCNQPDGANWRISVQSTCDLDTWNEVYTTTEPTFARSLTISDDTLYFALGADQKAPGKVHDLVGTVYQEQLSSTAACPG